MRRAPDAVDPANVYLWKSNRRRLDVEAWRDGLLAVAGTLDRTPGGPTYDLRDPNARRRTVYAKVSRHELASLLRLFDFPDANVTSDRRLSTTVPQQQLFALNSEFMILQAKAFAARVQKSAGDDAGRVRAAYRLAFGRAPSDREAALGELTRMRIHRVSAADIREYQDLGLADLFTDVLVRLRIHDVTPQFVRGLATRGYRGLLAEDLIRMRIHRVTLEEIDELKALGFGGLGSDELVKFNIHKVTPAFIREMRDVGFASVTEDQLVRMRIHKVDAQFVRDARADGYAMATPGDAVDLAIRGPRYTRARKR